ncbi:diacylglycerol kinase (ATP) [Paucimonas lemoignei]|uniref:Diacylglycerol kinase (ATP) n=1 Tax=Paucimonas lemoignei TaxID=29443 RepID=A0A4R3HW81_PAULE|nr:diacylglycerol kinase [Paucimonas lemoignei]TCS36501.1 diacylglycerol kinase (ATP) [Paucimonas lemoignei]
MKGQSFRRRAIFAWNGLKLAFGREKSFRAHVAATVAVIVVLVLLRPPMFWWVMLALTVGLVLVAELINSALEALIDHLHPDEHPEVGAAKDIAAAAVLAASGIAVAVGIIFLVDVLLL